jgi:hypothetical protein
LLLLSISFASQVASAQTDDKIARNFSLIYDIADRICNVAAQPTGQASSANDQTDVRRQLGDLSGKLASSGIAAEGLTSEQYIGVLQNQLTASVNNNVQCRVEVAKSMINSLSQQSSAQRVFSVTRESGWRGGGYSPDAWCNDLVSILRGEHPRAQFQVSSKSEQSTDRCKPFKCVQYNYACTVQVTTSAAN